MLDLVQLLPQGPKRCFLVEDRLAGCYRKMQRKIAIHVGTGSRQRFNESLAQELSVLLRIRAFVHCLLKKSALLNRFGTERHPAPKICKSCADICGDESVIAELPAGCS